MGNEIIEEIEERPDGSRKIVKRSVEKGVSFGSVLAMVISFVTWKSIGWAIVHGAMGWVYVIYYIRVADLWSDLTHPPALKSKKHITHECIPDTSYIFHA